MQQNVYGECCPQLSSCKAHFQCGHSFENLTVLLIKHIQYFPCTVSNQFELLIGIINNSSPPLFSLQREGYLFYKVV